MTKAERRLVYGLAATVTVAFGSILYGFSVFVTDEAAGADFSSTVLSLGLSGAAVVNGLAAPFVGRQLDRIGVRPVIALGSVLSLAGMAGFALAQSTWQVLAAWWLLLGPATAMVYYEPATTAISHWIPPERRTRAFGVLTLIGGLAGAVFIPLTERLVTWLGWRPTAFALGAMIAATGAIATWRFLPDGLKGEAEPPRRALGWRAMILDRRLVLTTAGFVLVYGSISGVLAHRVDRFVEAGFALAVAATWAAVASVVSLPGRYLAPRVSERLGGVHVLLALVAIAAVAVVVAIPGDADWSLAGHFLLFGFAFGAITPMRAVVMSNWYAGSYFGEISGSQWAVVRVVGAGGPVGVAVLRDSSGDWQTPLLAIVVLFVVGGALIWWGGVSRGAAGGRPAPGHTPHVE